MSRVVLTSNGRTSRRRTFGRAAATVLVAALWMGFAPNPVALADPADNLRSAVQQVRAGTSCGALDSDPIAEQAATTINDSTEDYLNHDANQIPISDPLPGLKILGYPGSKGIVLQGASKPDDWSIKALLLQGYDKIPDCSYTDFGADMRLYEPTGVWLTAVVLAGP